ncbi:hypothetical protein [Clostridium ganghwense]|uniref:Phage protein n=1 Tax=Clostridium ganghwense TaxID=312089 RepID=A0ABT4CTS6_9CLOT|nr:hypothetical protein [Clostridium ganghwense]MCY6372473.1 hypothetical protein [Clostridium ganghwense]
MLKIRVNEKEYEVNNCYENVSWTGERKEKSISINVTDINVKVEFDSFVGTNLNAEILSNKDVVLTIGQDYILKETFRNISNFQSSFSMRFEKVIS